MNPEVVEIVEEALRSNPGLTSQELKRRAAAVDDSVLDLSGRQFHAKYTIQARKRLGATQSSRPSSGSPLDETEVSPAVASLLRSYRDSTDKLNEALHDAFSRALSTDSVRRINELLTHIEAEIQALEDL